MRRTGGLCALTVAHMILIHVHAPWCMFDAGRGGFGHGLVAVYGTDAIIGRCNSLGGKALTHVLMRGLAASVEQSIVTIVLFVIHAS